MKYIHPFPARMAPDLALERLIDLPSNSVVLDPMSGSGMVVSQAAKMNIQSIGCDIDPLARLLSRVASTKVFEEKVWLYYNELQKYCRKNAELSNKTAWMGKDLETSNFIDYWFAEKQQTDLRLVSNFFATTNPKLRSVHKNVLVVALSRLIITKNPKASLARDTAHSRPHKTIAENDFEVLGNLRRSVEHVLKALNSDQILRNSRIYSDDARILSNVKNDTIDCVITSPPYLNAIDYMRGHKFALVWLGYSIGQLRSIRANSIGSERQINTDEHVEFSAFVSEFELTKLDHKSLGMLRRYYFDLKKQLNQVKRVLKPARAAHFVIGNSSIRGHFIKNSELLKFAAKNLGLTVSGENVRKIPDNRRYLPISINSTNSLAKRMRTEHVIEFAN
jgi:DNA modification methylase